MRPREGSGGPGALPEDAERTEAPVTPVFASLTHVTSNGGRPGLES